ncbi:hypothetical protein HNQ02_002777 [Flavobacterium sp. 7E]|uniref:SIMPL domain-containing protein n=1 Tax=unclassified Flavobacterium TaxID=196869 RepID=UPI00157018A3|nr:MULTISPECIES: SIMPL domain-containing protein [unclassified Flavobacterium]NRS89843.1 hypothetical protein [Flavobacterium sp. 7E]NRT16650.1 hypothetical protein [Flavobacterium sp. 28A]
MKKIVCLIALLVALPSIAQENKSTIEVVGETEKVVGDDSYTLVIALQQILAYEGQLDVEATSLDVVKKNFIKELEKIGIDFSRFKRNSYYEFAMVYSQNKELSEYYFLRTSDKDEFRKLTQLKSPGMSISNTEIEAAKLTDKQLIELSTKAIANAKEKAETIAKKLNKNIGEIVKISDLNTNAQFIHGYGTTAKQAHTVTVAYELK